MSRSKRKQKKVNELVAGVLKPSIYIGSQKAAMKHNWFQLLSDEDVVIDALKASLLVLFRSSDVQSLTNFFQPDLSAFGDREILVANDLQFDRLLAIYTSVIKYKSKELSLYKDLKNKIESDFICGNYKSAGNNIELVKNSLGETLWVVRAEFTLLALQNKYSDLTLLYDYYRCKNSEPFYLDIIRVYFWLAQTSDAVQTLDNMVVRTSDELINGGAVSIAAIYSICSLPYPVHNKVDAIKGCYQLQIFNYLDIYELLTLSCLQLLVDSTVDETEERKFLIKNVSEPLIEFSNLIDGDLAKKVTSFISKEGKIEVSESEIDRSVVERYNNGEYNKLIDLLENNYQDMDNIISNINMYSKSYLYSSRTPSSELPNLLKDLLLLFKNLYALKDTAQSIYQIISYVIRLSHLEVSTQLMVALVIAVPNYYDYSIKVRLNLFSKFLSKKITPVAINLNIPSTLCNSDLMETSCVEHRKIKGEIVRLINHANAGCDEIESLFNQYKNHEPILKDYIELKCEYFIRYNFLDELLKFSTKYLIKNPNIFISLPVSAIKDYIESGMLSSIDAVIFSYFYNQNNSTEENGVLLHETFEEFIYSKGGIRPSEIIESLSEMSDKELFLYKTIATAAVMDYLGIFESTTDLYVERLKLLLKLASGKLINEEDIQDECKDIIDSIVILTSAARISKSKISIDTKSIFNRKKQEIQTLIDLFKELKRSDVSGQTDEFIFLSDDEVTENQMQAIAKGSKNILVQRLIDLLHQDFIEELDNTLSAEIRHGFFNNLMCSRLEKRHLITDLDEQGEYKSNIYWRDYYYYVMDDILNDVDQILKRFSIDFNNTVEKAESWMKVSTDIADTTRVFKLIVDIKDFEEIRAALETLSDPEMISKVVFEKFFCMVESCMSDIKLKLNEDFTNYIDEIFIKLKEGVEQKKQAAPLGDLCSSVEITHNEIKEDIRTACEWFGLKECKEHESVPIEHLIRVSELCFKNSTSATMDIDISASCNRVVSGKHVSAVVLTIINCFNNSLKYGIKTSGIKVTINPVSENGFYFSISNEVTKYCLNLLHDGKFCEIENRLISMNSDKLLKQEGGTGLYKSLYYLKQASPHFNLVPSLGSDTFTVKVFYDA